MNNEYIERLVAVEQRSKSNTKRIDEHSITLTDHDRRIDELSDVYVALTKVNDKVDNVEKNITEMKDDIKKIKGKPAEKLDKLWGYFFSAIIGSVATSLIAAILANLGR